MDSLDTKVSVSESELEMMADDLTRAAGRLLALCKKHEATESAKKESKEDKKGPVASVGKAALMLKLKDKV